MKIAFSFFLLIYSRCGAPANPHVFEAHSFEPTFRYWCGISSCTRVFLNESSYDTFRGHCTRKNHNWQHNFTPTIEDPAGMSTSTITDTDCESTQEADTDGTREDTDGTQEDMDGTREDTDYYY